MVARRSAGTAGGNAPSPIGLAAGVLALVLVGACSAKLPTQRAASRGGAKAQEVSPTAIREVLWVKRHAGRYRFHGQRERSLHVLTRRDLEEARMYVFEAQLSRFTRFGAFVNRRWLPREFIRPRSLERRHIFMDDTRIHVISFPIARLGERIGYRYQMRYPNAALVPPSVVPAVEHLERYDLIVHHPPGVRVDFRIFSPRLGGRVRVVRGAGVTRAVLRDIRRPLPLPYYAHNGVLAALLPVLSVAGRSLQPVSAKAHAKWYLGLLPKEGALPARHRKFVARLVAGARTPRAKLQRIYDFVRRGVRYVADERGMGGLVPRRSHLVLDRLWGDCKDKTQVLIQLGRAVGLKLDPVLVGTRERPSFGDAWHTMQFDHLIASYRDARGRILLDATARTLPFGRVPDALVDKQALVVDPARPRAFRIAPGTARWVFDAQITVPRAGESEGTAEVVVRGRINRALLALAENYQGEALDHRRRALLSDAIDGASFTQLELVRQGELATRFRGRARIDGLLLRGTAHRYLAHAPFPSPSALLALRRGDALPIHLGVRPAYRLALLLPPGETTPQTPLPDDIDIGRAGEARFTRRFRRRGGRVEVTYTLRQPRRYFSGDPRRRLLEFSAAYRRWRGRFWRVGSRVAPVPGKPDVPGLGVSGGR